PAAQTARPIMRSDVPGIPKNETLLRSGTTRFASPPPWCTGAASVAAAAPSPAQAAVEKMSVMIAAIRAVRLRTIVRDLSECRGHARDLEGLAVCGKGQTLQRASSSSLDGSRGRSGGLLPTIDRGVNPATETRPKRNAARRYVHFARYLFWALLLRALLLRAPATSSR